MTSELNSKEVWFCTVDCKFKSVIIIIQFVFVEESKHYRNTNNLFSSSKNKN